MAEFHDQVSRPSAGTLPRLEVAKKQSKALPAWSGISAEDH